MHLVSVAGETDSARTVSLGEGRYLDTLVIHQVEERHAGLYVCFATNTAGGLNYQTAHLEVVTAEDQVDQVEEQGQEEQLFLGLVVGLVAVVLVLLITIFLCLIKTRKKQLMPKYFKTKLRRGITSLPTPPAVGDLTSTTSPSTSPHLGYDSLTTTR